MANTEQHAFLTPPLPQPRVLHHRGFLVRCAAWTVACSFVALSACSEKPAPAPAPDQAQTEPQPPAPAVSPINACALLTGEEIEAILGEAVQEQTPSAKIETGVANAQCFFKLPTFTKSISVSVTQGSGPGPHAPRAFWKTAFSDQKVQPPERADGRIKLAPERVEGLGEEAFWTGGPAGGLYVLKGETVLFIGIGSSGDEATRRVNVRRIAEIIVKRL